MRILQQPFSRQEEVVFLDFRAPAFAVGSFPEFLGCGVVSDTACVGVDVQYGLGAVGYVSQVAP